MASSVFPPSRPPALPPSRPATAPLQPSRRPVAAARPPAPPPPAPARAIAGYVDGKAPFQNDVWRFDMVAAGEEEEGAPEGAAEGAEGTEGAEVAAVGPSLGVWRRLNASGEGPAPAFGHTAAADGQGRVFLFGERARRFSECVRKRVGQVASWLVRPRNPL